jgi:eukaryotic-like serine/threonine-protein kinase
VTPDLTRWPEADDLLDRALALPAADRVAFVRRSAADPGLASALEAVLAEAEGDDGFLDPAGALTGSVAAELRSASEAALPTLTPGSLVEHYQVAAAIGRGGMGEVYRARDTRLARDVALKVLPERYANDPERRARFQREARVLASLNHPGIAAIYGVAESEGVEALVLELVEGTTLAEVLASDPLTLDAAIAIARQLVDAIAAAHARGILHRDLKPANIKIAPPSTVKILDFGLARVLASADAVDDHADLTEASPHVMLGTAAYMSPEQVRGRQVDERTDIWAFGCVLFEMLTGTRAFTGRTVPDVLAGVVEREPAFSLLPPATPAPIRRLLRRCLEKDPDRRLGYIGDARLELDDLTAPALEPPADARSTPWSVRLAWLAAGLALAASVALMIPRGAEPPAPVLRLVMPLPADDRPVTGFQPVAALSPDGRTLVYRARRGGTIQLFHRAFDALEPTAIPGTDNATSPFFSPDGRWLAFDADGVLKRVSMAGGTPVVICNAPGGVTAAWLPDDTIVFATNTSRALQRVPASGGTPAPLTTLDAARGDTLHLLPQVLPNGRALLFTIVTGSGRQVAALDLSSGHVRTLTEGTHGRYLEGGYLVFAREGALWVSRFDAERLSLAGRAIPVDERVAHTDNTVFHFTTGADGALVYLPPQATTNRRRLVWMDHQGHETPLDLEPKPYLRMSLAPDGVRVAFSVEENDNTDIWVADPSRQTMSRLTFEPTIETMPTWSPDGSRIAFRSEREGPGVFQRNAHGSGPLERLSVTDGPIHSPYSWTPDGKTLLLAVFRSFRSQAIGSITPPDTNVRIFLDGDFAQLDPQVSPDGRWMAYQSDETGRFEIYVRPYPAVDTARWQISTGGGTSPRWSPDGRTVYYYDGEALTRVGVEPRGSSIAAGRPTRMFSIAPFAGRLGPGYEVAPDGQRFLFLVPGPVITPPPAGFIVVQNWVQELRTRLQDAR